MDWCIFNPYEGQEVYIRTVSAEQIAARVQSVTFNPKGEGVALLTGTVEIVYDEYTDGPDNEARDGGDGHMPDSQVAFICLAADRWGKDWTIAKWRKQAGPQKTRGGS